MKLETLMSIKERRSVRSYRKEQISKEELDAVLEAGTYAASGMGRQPAKMVVVQEPELIAKLSKMNGAVMGADSDPFYGAPTVVIVFADTNAGTWLQDGSLYTYPANNMSFTINQAEIPASGYDKNF